ncbi:HopJ type III effector protein (plasmid) [Pseudoalteromonas xiamenensis]|uniref:HopJ type III effector protein n=1 Tax=Pseudoalteromonas xiamenensis TaxID=882626 RepID=UPI0027E54CA7|nr:HopJ type III effector protein [Pseudoalteromonas xiamenensis]WMN61827.1 HopJ type III effector protein [Pseudoalteromonas xiamenensis]
MLELKKLLEMLRLSPELLVFSDVIATIDAHYHFTAARFHNNGLDNEKGTNLGSCKVFAFAKQHKLTKDETLACFAEHYFKDVLVHKDSQSHQNIRHFMNSEHGLDRVIFDSNVLMKK